jgi:hypothetical protein
MGALLCVLILSAGYSVSAPAANSPLPTAKADSVGISGERLALLPQGMKSLVDQGRLAGVVTMVARHGKVVEFDAAGKRDIAANLPCRRTAYSAYIP